PVAEQHPTYLVPNPARSPKHLFHFIIRYEGEGIVDSNVVEAIKAQNSATPSAAPPVNVLPPNLTQAIEPTVMPPPPIADQVPTLPPPKEVKEAKGTAKPPVDKKDKGATDAPTPKAGKKEKGEDKKPS